MTAIQVFSFFVLPVALGLLAWIGTRLNDRATARFDEAQQRERERRTA